MDSLIGRQQLRGLAPVLLFVGGAWAVTVCRLTGRWRSHLPCSSPRLSDDLVLHLWQYGWLRQSIAEGFTGFRSDLFTFPAQLDLLTVWGGHLDLLLAAPFAALGEVVLASNFAMTLLLGSCGLGVYLLARGVTEDRVASAMAGALYMLSPPVLNEALAGRTEQLSGGLVAMFLLFSGRWLAQGRLRSLWLALVFFSLASLAWLGSAVLCSFLLPALGLGFLLVGPRGSCSRMRLVVRALPLAGLLALPCLAAQALLGPRLGTPFLLPASSERWGLVMGELAREWLQRSDVARVALEDQFTPLPLGRPAGVGIVLVLAALLSLAWRERARRGLPWWLGALLLHSLALGPWLIQPSGMAAVPSPYQWLPRLVPFFLRFHWPNRFLLLAGVCLAVLAALAVSKARDSLQRRFGRRWILLPAALLCVGALQVGQRFPLPVQPLPSPPQAYQQLAQDGAGALFELSPGPTPTEREGSDEDSGYVHSPFLAQLEHRLPFCCLDIPDSLKPTALVRLQERDDFFAYLSSNALRPPQAYPSILKWEPDRGALLRMGFSHVVVQGQVEDFARKGWCPAHQGSSAPGRSQEFYCSPYQELSLVLRHHLGDPVIQQKLEDGVLEVYEIQAPSSHEDLAVEPSQERR